MKNKEYNLGVIFVYTTDGGWRETCNCGKCKSELNDYVDSTYTDWHGDCETTRVWKCNKCGAFNKIIFHW